MLDNQPDQITNGLYLSSLYEARFKKEMHKIGIKHILVVGDMLTQNFPNVKTF
jgi:hypothetical protein